MKIARYTFRILFVIYISVLFFLSLYSFKSTPVNLSFEIFGIEADKVVHFIMYLPFPFSAWFAFGGFLDRVFGKYSKYCLFASGILVATLTEVLQSTTVYRYSDLYDMIANYTAIVIGTLAVLLIDRYAKNVWPGRLQ